MNATNSHALAQKKDGSSGELEEVKILISGIKGLGKRECAWWLLRQLRDLGHGAWLEYPEHGGVGEGDRGLSFYGGFPAMPKGKFVVSVEDEVKELKVKPVEEDHRGVKVVSMDESHAEPQSHRGGEEESDGYQVRRVIPRIRSVICNYLRSAIRKSGEGNFRIRRDFEHWEMLEMGEQEVRWHLSLAFHGGDILWVDDDYYHVSLSGKGDGQVLKVERRAA